MVVYVHGYTHVMCHPPTTPPNPNTVLPSHICTQSYKHHLDSSNPPPPQYSSSRRGRCSPAVRQAPHQTKSSQPTYILTRQNVRCMIIPGYIHGTYAWGKPPVFELGSRGGGLAHSDGRCMGWDELGTHMYLGSICLNRRFFTVLNDGIEIRLTLPIARNIRFPTTMGHSPIPWMESPSTIAKSTYLFSKSQHTVPQIRHPSTHPPKYTHLRCTLTQRIRTYVRVSVRTHLRSPVAKSPRFAFGNSRRAGWDPVWVGAFDSEVGRVVRGWEGDGKVGKWGRKGWVGRIVLHARGGLQGAW